MIRMGMPSVAMEMEKTDSETDLSDLEFGMEHCVNHHRNRDSLIWKEFFGSSVDLTPSLLSMYDKLTTSNNGGLSQDSLQNGSHGLFSSSQSPETRSNVKLLANEEIRFTEMEDSVDSASGIGQKRPLSVGSTSSSSSASLPSQYRNKRPNLGDFDMSVKTGATPTLQEMANSSNTSTDSLNMGEDWLETSPSHQDNVEDEHYYEQVNVSAGPTTIPIVKVYSPQNSSGSVDDVSLNSSTQSDEKGDNSPVCEPVQSTFCLKLNTPAGGQSDSIKRVDGSVTRLSANSNSSIHSPVLSKDSSYYVSYAQRVASEIVETEKSYVHSLLEIIEGYMKHIKQCNCITEQEFVQLFGNLEDIYAFNKELLIELEECGEDPVEVARCFVEKNEGFDIYTEYCTNYPESMEVLTNCMMQPALAEKFKSWQAALGHGLPLGAFLLKPVQRILKYHLLLQNIVKNYEPDRPGYETLTTALDHMTHMAHHINEMKRRHEHAVRVQEVQSQLEDYEGPDLATLGELVLEGSFRLLGAKASRSVFLFEKGILITKRKEEGLFSCKAVILCSNLMLVESISKEPLSFHVIPFDNTKVQYTLQARSLEMKRKWCQEIKRLILESYMGRIPDKVKSLVMGLGRTRAEEEEEQGNHGYHLTADEKKPRRKSANLMDLVKLKKAHKKNETTPPRLAPANMALQSSAVTNSAGRLTAKTNSKMLSGSRSMDNLSMTGSNTIPRTKTPSEGHDSMSDKTTNKNGGDTDTLASHLTFGDPETSESSQVRRAKSFKIATRANPVTSIDISDNEDSSVESEEISSDEDNSHLDDDVYVSLVQNNGDSLTPGARVSSMPLLNADFDEPDYVTVRLDPERGVPVSSSSHVATSSNTEAAESDKYLTVDDAKKRCSNLIYQNVEYPKDQDFCVSASSSYDNLHQRWSSGSQQTEEVDNEGLPAVVPPPAQFADSIETPPSRAPERDIEDLIDPWVKQSPDRTESNGSNKGSNYSCVMERKRQHPIGKSYSFPLCDNDTAHRISRENFDWFVYSHKIASSLSKTFNKLKVLDKAGYQQKYPGYVTDMGVKDKYSLQEKKTIVRYGTPPRNALTAEKMKQFAYLEKNSKTNSDKVSSKFLSKPSAQTVKTWFPLTTPHVWDSKNEKVTKQRTGLSKVTEKYKVIKDSQKIVEEMEKYAEKNDPLRGSSGSLGKFPSASSLSSQKSGEDKFKFPAEFKPDRNSDSWSRDSISSGGNFMSRSRESLSSSTSSLNKIRSSQDTLSNVSDSNATADGFVVSLRSKLSNLTSRLSARKQMPSINSTFNPPRSLSTGHFTSTFNARYKPQNPVQSQKKSDGFVSHLTRMYNAREQTPPRQSPPKKLESSPLEKSSSNYASVLRSRQLGSPALGSRLAASSGMVEPKVRSLPRQLTAPPALTSDNDTHSETTSVHSLDWNSERQSEPVEKIEFISNNIQESDSAVSIQSRMSATDTPLSPMSARRSSCGSVGSSTDSIYERRLSRALEEQEDNVFRDSAVYSDMDSTSNYTVPQTSLSPPRKSIREVVQLLEERARPKQPEVVDVRRREPGRTIQEKLKSLRESSQYHRRTQHFDDEVEGLPRPLGEVRRSLGTSRSSVDREESGYTIRYSRGYPGQDEGIKMARSTSRLDQIDNVNTLMTMKGWVRQLINKFQADQ